MSHQAVVDSHGALEVTPPAGGAIPEGICHLLQLFICKSGIAEDSGPQNPRYREMTPVDREQQFRSVAGDIPLVTGNFIYLAIGAASGTLGADPNVLIQGNAVVGVFQDGCEGFEKAARTIIDVEILDMIPNGQTLSLDYIRFPWNGKSLLSFFLSKRSHESPTFSLYD
jgi:hypothetical protein